MKKSFFIAGVLLFCAALAWGDDYVWIGGNGVWSNPGNWFNSTTSSMPAIVYPGDTNSHDTVFIPSGAVSLDVSIYFPIASVTIAGLASLALTKDLPAQFVTNQGNLYMNGWSITETSSNADLINYETIYFTGGGTIANVDTVGGMAEFTGGTPSLAQITNFNNLTISGGSHTLSNDIVVGGQMIISGGTVTLNGWTITVASSSMSALSQSGGVIDSGIISEIIIPSGGITQSAPGMINGDVKITTGIGMDLYGPNGLGYTNLSAGMGNIYLNNTNPGNLSVAAETFGGFVEIHENSVGKLAVVSTFDGLNGGITTHGGRISLIGNGGIFLIYSAGYVLNSGGGDIYLTGIVHLNDNAQITAGTGSIQIDNTINGPSYDLEITAGMITTLNGAHITVHSLTVPSADLIRLGGDILCDYPLGFITFPTACPVELNNAGTGVTFVFGYDASLTLGPVTGAGKDLILRVNDPAPTAVLHLYGDLGSSGVPLGNITLDNIDTGIVDHSMYSSGIIDIAVNNLNLGASPVTLKGTTINHTGGNINVGPVTSGPAVTFDGNYTASGGTTFLKGNATYNPDIVFMGDVTLRAFTPNGDRMVFSGTGDQNLNAGTSQTAPNQIGDVLINNSTGKVRLVNNDVTQTGDLTIVAWGGLDLNGKRWCMGASPSIPGFHGVAGNFTMGAGATLSADAFAVDSGCMFVAPTSGRPPEITVTTRDFWVDTSPSSNFTNVSLFMQGTYGDIGMALPLGYLTVYGGDKYIVWPLTLEKDLVIDMNGTLHVDEDITKVRDVTMTSNGCLIVGNDKKITVEGNWNQSGGLGLGGSNAFDPASGTVEFKPPGPGRTVSITGATRWFNFVCTTPGTRLEFSTHIDSGTPGGTPTSLNYLSYYYATIFHEVTGSIEIGSSSGAPVIVTRIDHTGNAMGNPPSSYPDILDTGVSPTDRDFFWDLNIGSAATVTKRNVEIWYNYAMDERIFDYPTPAYPYHFNYKYTKIIAINYAYTEDAIGGGGYTYNGGIDRIRIEAAGFDPGENIAPLSSGSLSAIQIYDKNDGYRYQIIGSHVPSSSGNPQIIYLTLNEREFADGGAELIVYIPTGVIQTTTGTPLRLRQDFANGLPVIDTVYPRINYALALPGGDEIFVQMTEPVNRTDMAALLPSTVTFSGVSVSVTSFDLSIPGSTGPGVKEFKLKLDTVIPASDLAAAVTPAFTLGSPGSYKDMGSVPPGVMITGNNPRYHSDSTYSGTPVANATRPDFSLPSGTASHRVTDVLISIKPDSPASDRYFVWPDNARDANPNSAGRGASAPSLLRDFTGGGSILRSDLTLEFILNPTLTSTLDSIHAAVNVPNSFKAKSQHGPVGLWLPNFPLSPFPGIVPGPYTGASLSPPLTSITASNYTSNFPGLNYPSGSKVEFFFKLDSSDLPVACLAGSSSDPAWYRKVRPFGFTIQDMTHQRGGVTVLNNVIDPTRGEKATLVYRLGKSGRVSVQVFSLAGNLVKVLERTSRSEGEYDISWDGTNQAGRPVARGIYFIRVVAPEIDEIRKVMVVR